VDVTQVPTPFTAVVNWIVDGTAAVGLIGVRRSELTPLYWASTVFELVIETVQLSAVVESHPCQAKNVLLLSWDGAVRVTLVPLL
jgi:hypothetical protein